MVVNILLKHLKNWILLKAENNFNLEYDNKTETKV